MILNSGVTRTTEEAGDLCAHGPFMAKPYDHGEVACQIGALLTRR